MIHKLGQQLTQTKKIALHKAAHPLKLEISPAIIDRTEMPICLGWQSPTLLAHLATDRLNSLITNDRNK